MLLGFMLLNCVRVRTGGFPETEINGLCVENVENVTT
jgi:hypothetical protein